MRLLPGILFSLILFFSTNLRGTAQIPDILIINGEKFPLRENPLESYLRTSKLPDDWTRNGLMSTANYRGYIATWELKGGALLLRKVEKEYRKKTKNPKDFETEMKEVDLRLIFGEKIKKHPIPAIWYSGILKTPKGKLLKYIHGGYASQFEGAHLIRVEKGKVIREKKITYSEYGLSRSVVDINRTVLFDPPEPNRDWVDLRTVSVADPVLHKKIVTRGILTYLNGHQIRMPQTPKSQRVSLPVLLLCSGADDEKNKPGKKPVRYNWEWVEVRAEIKNGKLNVWGWRKLKNGETIHHPNYKGE